MRIGIITFQWFNNYGTVLQAFALQTVLRKLGHEVNIVPLQCNQLTGWRRFLAKTPRGFLMKLKRFLWERGNRRRNDYDAFRAQNFEYGGVSPLTFAQALCHKWTEDVLIWGSDNIWGPWCVVPEDRLMSGVFYGDGIKHARKIAYAASTGARMDQHGKYQEVIDRIRAAGFEKIGLRESVNVRVFEAESVMAQHVPDPSLLLMAEEWGCVEDVSLIPATPYVFGYELGHIGSISIRQGCEAIARQIGCEVRIPYPQAFWKNRDVACYPKPLEWIALLHHAECVVTDSFHGVMFSLIFQRPFVYIPGKDEGGLLNMRVNEILSLVNLKSRILPQGADETELKRLMAESIDWDRVSKALAKFREIGLEFLRTI